MGAIAKSLKEIPMGLGFCGSYCGCFGASVALWAMIDGIRLSNALCSCAAFSDALKV